VSGRRDIRGGVEDALWRHVGGEGRRPKAIVQAAGDLGELYSALNDGQGVQQLLKQFRKPVKMDIDEHAFGVLLADAALGTPGSAAKQLLRGFGIAIPHFELSLEDDVLVWDGGADDFEGNPAGLTAKGERMYEDIKRGYGKDPRAKEIAARTVRARAKEGVPGLFKKNSCSCSFSHTHNPSDHWPKSEVQSLLFDRQMFTEAQAKAWAKEHGYLYGSVDTTGSYHRLRQEAPTGGPCRTIEFTAGVKAIVCATGRGLPPGVPSGR